MRWLARIKWWLHVYREVGRLQGEVARYARLWQSADQQRQALAAALKDSADAGLQALDEEKKRSDGRAYALCAEVARRDAEIQRLTMRLTLATANDAPLMRYVNALNVEHAMLALIGPVEALKVGIYRSADRLHLFAAYKALTEQESVGWELLGTEDAVRELRRRARIAAGVWN